MAEPAQPTAAPADASFSDMLQDVMASANEPHLQANAAIEELVQGKTDDVHNVVMSVVQADMSFRFMLEVRNRLTDAYQEIMRMQV